MPEAPPIPALITGVGSLPFERYDVALRHVFAHYSLPFYPQLPQARTPGPASEGPAAAAPMLREVLTADLRAAFARRDATAFIMHLERAGDPQSSSAADEWLTQRPGLSAFLARAADVPAVKLQGIGPATAYAALVAAFAPKVLPPDELRAATARWVLRAALTAIRAVAAATAARILFVWDDLYLTAPDAGVFREALSELQRTAPASAQIGVHSCAATALRPLAALGARPSSLTLSVDANVLDFRRDANAAAARAHAAGGGAFVFGVVDTRATQLDVAGGLAAARTVAQVLHDGGAVLAPPLILSGGCGTGLHPPLYEEALVKVLQTASALLVVGG